MFWGGLSIVGISLSAKNTIHWYQIHDNTGFILKSIKEII